MAYYGTEWSIAAQHSIACRRPRILISITIIISIITISFIVILTTMNYHCYYLRLLSRS